MLLKIVSYLLNSVFTQCLSEKFDRREPLKCLVRRNSRSVSTQMNEEFA